MDKHHFFSFIISSQKCVRFGIHGKYDLKELLEKKKSVSRLNKINK